MDGYVKFVLKHNQTMPDPTEDILRISDLHSWYKHLGDFTKAYPILIQGEEPAYSFSSEFTDADQNNFHWAIVMDYNMDRYTTKLSDNDNDDENEYYLTSDIQEFMKKYPIYLDYDFCSINESKSNFLRLICKKMCEEFWNGLVEYQTIIK